MHVCFSCAQALHLSAPSTPFSSGSPWTSPTVVLLWLSLLMLFMAPKTKLCSHPESQFGNRLDILSTFENRATSTPEHHPLCLLHCPRSSQWQYSSSELFFNLVTSSQWGHTIYLCSQRQCLIFPPHETWCVIIQNYFSHLISGI